MTINDVRYELNNATASDAQVEFASDPDEIIHTSNGDTHKKLLRRRMIGICNKDISVLAPLMVTNIDVNNNPYFIISAGFVQVPHALQLPVVQ